MTYTGWIESVYDHEYQKKRNWKTRILGAQRRVSEIANGIRVLGYRGRSFSATDVTLILGDKEVSRNMITEEQKKIWSEEKTQIIANGIRDWLYDS